MRCEGTMTGDLEQDGAAATAVTRSSSLHELLPEADEAAARGDGEALAAAMLPLIALVPAEVAIDAVAVLELCRYDVALASGRWAQLREALSER
jgi:hypothetical protein